MGPEQLLSICLALDFYGRAENRDGEILAALLEGVRGVTGAEFAVVDDEAGRPIQRLEVRTPRAAEVAAALRTGTPPIYVRAHHLPENRFLIDTRNLTPEDATTIATALKQALGN